MYISGGKGNEVLQCITCKYCKNHDGLYF